MKYFLLLIWLFIGHQIILAQSIRINEVMSSNGGVVEDEEGDTPDWIELYNSGSVAVNLNGYGLSDDKATPFKWTFPSFAVNPGRYQLVFASDKDRREVPLYWNTLVSSGDDWKYHVPAAEPTTNWRTASFNDATWSSGKSGFGMGDDDDATVVTVSRSIFLRKKFNVASIANVRRLVLHMDYDDGFVAYLNGVEIARSQMEGKGALPRFDVLASGQHEALMYGNGVPEIFEVNNPATLLKAGENILAIQVHNQELSSSDLSAIPFLSIATTDKPLSPRVVNILRLRNTAFHTNFKLDGDGESLYLTNPSGMLIDSVRIIPLMINYSYGRSAKDATKWVVFGVSTPEKANTGEEFSGEKPPKPVFSIPGGVYSASMKVAVSTPNRNDTIYYTLDGTIPTRQSQRVIREIDIPATRVIKARILKSGMLPGDVVTNSYIIYNNHNLPVVSISMNPEDLWNYNTGIYVDGPGWTSDNPHFGANYWMDWEKACHFELMESTGKKVTEVDAGVAIFGNWSRAHPQKSLAIYCRKAYGYDEIDYKLFDERPYEKYKSIVLRNSGNDWNNTMFRDAMIHGLTYGLNMDQQAYRPAIIFLNGEYWGIQNIREKINEHMIAQHHNVHPDSITILENDGAVIQGNANDYWTMFNFAENNSLATQTNYNRMLQYMDVESFIDYWATQIYVRNHDWPGNNIRYWKTNDTNGRWRWILFDTDFGMGMWNESPAENTLAFAMVPDHQGWPNPPWSTLLLRKLTQNTYFVNKFVNRFADLLNTNFKAENVNKAIDLKSAGIANEIEFHLRRWSGGSKNDWLSNVQNMKNFANARPAYVMEHLRQQFVFQSPQLVTAVADSMQGLIKLNSLTLRKFPWKGSYFPDVPITLTAIPKAGYKFVKWTGITTGSTSATVKVSPQANLSITAVFEPDGTQLDDIVINEISYNNNAANDPGDWIELYNKGAYDMDISGWKITDSDPAHQYVFGANTILKAKEYLVLSNDLALMNNTFSVEKNLYGPFNFGLSTTADAVKLFTPQGQLVDEVTYSNILPWPTDDLGRLWSIELKHPTIDNNIGSNWVISINYGTPGKQNTPYITSVSPEFASGNTELMQNYPNPFTEGTYIECKLDEPGSYMLLVMDVNGRILRKLKGDSLNSSVHTLYWDGKDDSGRNVPAGIYFYRMEAKGYTAMKRMVKIK